MKKEAKFIETLEKFSEIHYKLKYLILISLLINLYLNFYYSKAIK